MAVTGARTNTGQTAAYGYESTNRSKKLDKKCGLFTDEFSFIPNLKTASTPEYRGESFEYDHYLPMIHFGKSQFVKVTYQGSPLRVKTLHFPNGNQDAFIPLYTIDIDPPISNQKSGTTTVTRKDGCQTIYTFSHQMLPQSIRWLAPDGKTVKLKVYGWDADHRLTFIEWRDGDNRLFYRKSFEEYDSFNNPQKERMTGDLTGSGSIETYTISRVFSKDRMNLILQEETEDGLTTTFRYVDKTNLLKSKYTRGEGVHVREFFEYDASNNLIRTILDDGSHDDPDDMRDITEQRIVNYTLRQSAPFLHMPEQIEERSMDGSLIKKTKLTYDKWGNVAEEEVFGSDDQLAYSVKKEFDEQGNIVSETNPLQCTAVSSYDPRGFLLTSATFSNRLKTERAYNAAGRLKEKVETGGEIVHTTRYDYDIYSRLIKETDPFGNDTEYKEYDSVAAQPKRIDEPLGIVNKNLYDGLGRFIEKIDPNNHATHYRYNAYGSPVEIIYPDGTSEKYVYYKNGKMRSYTDQRGVTAEYFYDVLERPTKKKFSFQKEQIAQEIFTYSSFHLETHTDKEKRITTYKYDGAGRKREETFCGRTKVFEYNPIGQLAAVTEGGTLKTEYDRDPLDQILEIRKTDLKGELQYRIGYGWDPDGNQISTTRYPHNQAAVETSIFDPFGRITEWKDPIGFSTTTKYLESSHLQTISTDPNGIETTQIFDACGRLTSTQIGALYKEIQKYDFAGNLIEKEEASLKTRYEYDSLNRIKTLTRAYGSPDARTTTYTYKPGGLLGTKTFPNKTSLTYEYTPLGHLHFVDSSDDSIHQIFEHDLNGQLLSAIDDHHVFTRILDDFGNILTETINGISVQRTYDPLNRLASITFPDQSSAHYIYEALYLKTVQRFSASHQPLYIHTYSSYDLSGNLITEEFIHNLGSQSHTWNTNRAKTSITSPYFTQTLEFDPGSRIRSISSDGTYEYNDQSELTLEHLPDRQCIYAYDLHHNRSEKNGHTTVYNLLDEPITLDHDLNGNLQQNSQFQYRYDSLNRLTEAENSETQIVFSYDALDRCIAKTVNGLREIYLYHGIEELGAFHPDGQTKELKIPGLPLRPVAIELVDEVFAPICDYRGNIRRLIDATGQIAGSYDYTAFGEDLVPIISLNPWRYCAKRFDSRLGLYAFEKRFYDPSSARWSTTDPAGFMDGTNLYTYLHNDPLRNIDPSGTFAFPLIGLSWGASSWVATALCSHPVGWAIGGTLMAAVAIGWATQQLIDTRHISTSTKGIAETIAKGLISSLGSSAGTKVCSTGYGGYVYLDKNHSLSKNEVRVDPKNLSEQLTLEEAKAKPQNSKEEIMQGKIKDSRYPEKEWKKVEHTHEKPDGTKIDIHYWENRITGARHGFKFKNK